MNRELIFSLGSCKYLKSLEVSGLKRAVHPIGVGPFFGFGGMCIVAILAVVGVASLSFKPT